MIITYFFYYGKCLKGFFMEKLVLIDGNSLINRAFYAMPLLTTRSGIYTNAVYGFMNMFFKMYSDIKPDYVAVAFDLKAPTFRHKMYREYKGTRKPMPEELRPQIPLLKETLNAMGVATLEKEGFEADDIIGSVAKSTDIYTVIFTGDRDSFQLVDENISVYFTKKGITETEIYNADNFYDKTGIFPSQVIELKALMGDSSDNIPGVKGVGEKTAISLIKEYGTIDVLYEHTSDLKGKLLGKITEGKDSAFFSRTLATIDTDCGIKFDKEKMTFSFPLPVKVREKFVELEFKGLSAKDELYALDDNETKGNTDTESVLVRAENIGLLNDVKFSYPIAIAEYDNSVNVFDGKNTEYAFPIRRTLLDDGFSEAEAYGAIIKAVKGKVIVYSKKDTRKALQLLSLPSELPDAEDVSVIKYLAEFSGKAETFKDLLLTYGKNEKFPALALWQIYGELYGKLIGLDMEKLYRDIELPLTDVLFDMENAGFKVELSELYKTGEKYAEILFSLEKDIKNLAGEENLNVNSAKQLGEVLFEKLKIGKGKKTKTGYSTSADVLESFIDAHPIVPLILKYRQIQKLQSTYIEGLKPLVDKTTGLVHTKFNQTATSTGRLSSSEPNLQNIPVRDDEGREIRKYFVPREENGFLVSADYSQIELRLLAHLSGCQSLINSFNSGEDIHAETASKVFGVSIKDVTPQMRRDAKAVNFGIIYGISEFGLGKNLNISAKRAKDYIESYFAQFPEIKVYLDGLISSAREKGYAETMFGRKRFISEIYSNNFSLRQFGERAAMNMPLQGTSADIIKIAMVNVEKRLRKENLKSKLILQVHDELIIDATAEEKDRVTELLKREMEHAVDLKVRLDISVGFGKSWYEAK